MTDAERETLALACLETLFDLEDTSTVSILDSTRPCAGCGILHRDDHLWWTPQGDLCVTCVAHVALKRQS